MLMTSSPASIHCLLEDNLSSLAKTRRPPTKIPPPQSVLFSALRYPRSKLVHWLKIFVSCHEDGERSDDLDIITSVVEEARCEVGGNLWGHIMLTPRRRMSWMDMHLIQMTSH